jgi:hypothetical protein
MKTVTGRTTSETSNWLMSRSTDLLLLFLPVWAVWAVFFSNPTYFQTIELPLWAWVVFILGVDVSHVWSSLFRTYLDKEEFAAHKTRLILVPIIVLAASISLLYISIPWFWRIMAYVAVFHFIKQQYGFAALYKYRAGERRKQFISDKLVVYVAALYPVVFWHFNSQSSVNWFVQNDFFNLHSLVLDQIALQQIFYVLNWCYWIFIANWLIGEIRAHLRGEKVVLGKVLWILTTALNWWFGIVYFNSDVIFSVSNVVAHGVPYLALIYYYRIRKEEVKSKARSPLHRRLKWSAILLTTVGLIALVEEYFWDMLVYREHGAFFEVIYPYEFNQLTSNGTLIVAIAILALPQQVHYIIDGFIWKMNARNKYLKPVFKPSDES